MNVVRKEVLRWSMGLYCHRAVSTQKLKKDIETEIAWPLLGVGVMDYFYLINELHLFNSPTLDGLSMLAINGWLINGIRKFNFYPDARVRIDSLIERLNKDTIDEIRSEYRQIAPLLMADNPSVRPIIISNAKKDWLEQHKRKIIRGEAPITDINIINHYLTLPEEVSRVICSDK